jgi:hypothetical protein
MHENTYKVLFVFTAAILGIVLKAFLNLDQARRRAEEIQSVEKKAEAEPDKLTPAWQLARLKLEQYFDRNLGQAKAVFWVAILVMVADYSS